MNRTHTAGLVLALLLPSPALAQAPGPDAPAAAESEPRAAIDRAVDQVMTTLRDPRFEGPANRGARIERVREIVDGVFDWSAMAQSALGPYWRKLDEAQRRRFVAVFRDVLAAEHVQDFDKFRGNEEVTIDEVRRQGDATTVQTTLITHDRTRVPIDYTMRRQADGRWMVHDFTVEGVSIVNHYRGSFSRYLVNHSFDELMQTLERRRRVLTEAVQGASLE